MWYFVYRNTQELWHRVLVGADDIRIAESARVYCDKQDCLRDIDLVKRSQDVPIKEQVFDLRTSF